MLGADLGLALTYVPLRNRGALAALFAIDVAMGDVVRSTKEPMLGPIRLAWWRERLDELDEGTRAPAEPRLQAVERELLPRGISGHDIAGLEEGWLRLFDPFRAPLERFGLPRDVAQSGTGLCKGTCGQQVRIEGPAALDVNRACNA
jgi:phytoene synthase